MSPDPALIELKNTRRQQGSFDEPAENKGSNAEKLLRVFAEFRFVPDIFPRVEIENQF